MSDEPQTSTERADEDLTERRSFLRWAGAGAVGGAAVATHLVGAEPAGAVEGDFYITVDSLPVNAALGPGTLIHAVAGTESYQVRADQLVNEVPHTIATIGGASATADTWGDATVGTATEIVSVSDTASQTLRFGPYAGFGPSRPGPILRIVQAGTRAVKFESTGDATINSLAGGTGPAVWTKGRWAVVQARPLTLFGTTTVWVLWGDLRATDPGA
jgi:hypothetical protein